MHGSATHDDSPAAASASSLSDAIDSQYLFLICLVAALGGLLFGYDWVVIGGAKPFYEAYFQLTTEGQIGWANSCALLGCLAGSLASGVTSDRLGRKKMLLASALLFVVSSLLTAWSFSFSAFVFWRIMGGVAIGIASNVSPTYIAEISPAAWRGRLVALNQFTIVFGILFAQIANWLIARQVPADAGRDFIRQSWNGQLGWRWMFAAVAVPSLIFLLSALFVPESPRWLMSVGRLDRARRVLSRVGGAAYAEAVLKESEQIPTPDRMAALAAGLKAGGFRKALLIGVALAVLQQWSGINILFNYAEEIYRSAGYSVNGIMFNIVITGAINVLCTLIAFAFVDSAGRRRLMLIGCAAIACSHLAIGAAFLMGMRGLPVLLLTLAAIGAYAMSLAPVTWVLISEIFPNRMRGVGVSLAVSALWISSFLLTFSFPWILSGLKPAGAFTLYAAICFAGWLFVFRKVPETRGKSLEEIEALLSR